MDHGDHNPPWWTRSVQDHLGPRSAIFLIKQCFSSRTPRTLCLFSQIRRTFSPLNLLLSSRPNPSRPLDAIMSTPASHRPANTFPCPLNLSYNCRLPSLSAIAQHHLMPFVPTIARLTPSYWPTHFNILSLPDSIGIYYLFPLLHSHNIHI